MRELVKELAGLLEQGRDAVLAVIVEQSGSTPRDSGSAMVVRQDGSIAGSVGGGIMEARVMRRAADLFRERASRLMRFDLGADQAAEAGMLCGGRATLLLDHLAATRDNAELLARALARLAAGRPAVLGAAFRRQGERLEALARLVLDPGQDPETDDPVMTALGRAMDRADRPCLVEDSGLVLAVTPLGAHRTAFLFGAGHVALHTARLAAQVGFRTVVLDDRPDFANQERFPLADEVLVVPCFTNCLAGLEVAGDSFLLVLTRGHLHDKTVLAQALGTPAAYIGMIGSRRKRDATYAALRLEGVADQALARVHCPIGLAIGAETPEEIAVSIVAEMIQVRSALGEP